MTKENKARIVKCLRETKKKFGTGTLIDDNGCYCSLGVIASEICGRTDNEILDSNNYLDVVGCVIDTRNEIVDIYTKNDKSNSFAEVADFIEEEL